MSYKNGMLCSLSDSTKQGKRTDCMRNLMLNHNSMGSGAQGSLLKDRSV